MIDIYREIGNNIRIQRHQRRMTQQQLSKKIGLTRTSLVQIESGKQKIYLDKIYTIAEIFDISVYDLIPDNRNLLFDKISIDRTTNNEKEKIIKFLEKHNEK